MEEEEYSIVSKKEFLALKKEIEKLKKNPLEGSDSGETLQASIDNLNKSLNVMLEVFKQASEDLKLEEHESETVGKQIAPMQEKLDTLIDQNQKIAKGLVTIADMVKEKLEEISEKAAEKPRLPPLSGGPAPRQMPQPSFAPQQSFGPPQAPPGMPQFGMPEGLEEPRKNVMGGLMR
jgi:chromosome segregation ATPase